MPSFDLWATPDDSIPETVEATFHVATDGNDGWSGKVASPNAGKSDGPFATLQRARDAVRELIKDKQSPKEAITVVVRNGKYFFDQTLVFGPEDSGSPEAPITYRSAPGEKVTLSGGKRVAGWKPYKGQILQAVFPDSHGRQSRLRQLFFNGERQIRARYPNFEPENPIFGGWLYTQGRAATDARKAFNYKPGSFKRHWAKPSQAEVYMHVGQSNRIAIQSIDEKNCVITLEHEVKDFKYLPYAKDPVYIGQDPDGPAAPEGTAFYVENVLEELDQPGEWCLDGEDGVLYFWPPRPIEGEEIVIPVLDCLVDLQDASWITIAGFTFTETTGGEICIARGTKALEPSDPGPGKAGSTAAKPFT